MQGSRNRREYDRTMAPEPADLGLVRENVATFVLERDEPRRPEPGSSICPG